MNAARREGPALPPFAAWLMALALALPGPAPAAPRAGTAVDNTAHGSARDSLSGQAIAAASNTVTAIVQPLDGVALAPDRGAFGLPGDRLVLAHTLVNTGNLTTDFRLDPANLGGDDFDAATFSLVQDRDRDGLFGPGDTPVANGGVVTLAAGDSAAILLLATLPATAPGASFALVSLTATTLAQGAAAAVTDTLRTGTAFAAPALAFYDGALFGRVAHSTALGAPLWLQASAPRCDLDPSAPDTLRIDLASRLVGDRLTVTAIETGPHTGVFRTIGVPVAPWSPTFAPTQGNVLLQSRGDEITATLAGCGAAQTSAVVWVEPGGTVFDARTGAPIPGVRVRLLDETGAGNGGVPGGAALVWQDDGVTAAPAVVTTAADGRFEFPLVRASTYRLDFLAPAPWRVPSALAPALLPPGHVIDASGSYGGAFTIPDSLAPVDLDVPGDLVTPVTLFAEKSASPAVVEWGDAVEYRLRVANRSDSVLTGAIADDALPRGFALVPGSARLGGRPLAVSSDARGALSFPLGTLAPGAETEVRYRARVGPDAARGNAASSAVARAGALRSNVATATVQVRADVFADEGVITGRVSLASAAGVPGSGMGVAGVRLYLDDGSYSVTDESGQYSFTDVTPRTHALKLDAVTLPPLSKPVAMDHRGAFSPTVRFVDVARGDLVRADFALVGDTTVTRAVEERRVIAAARGTDERARALALPFDARPPLEATGDPRALPASRIVTGETSLPVIVNAAAPLPLAEAPPSATGEVVTALALAKNAALASAASPSLEQQLASLPPEPGFIGIADLDTVPAAQLTVTAKGHAGDVLTLQVNGVAVSADRIGRRLTATATGVEAYEWIGVALRPGLNVLALQSHFDAAPVWVRVVAPGPFAKLAVIAPRAVPADGHTPALLTLRATDASGVRVGGRTLVTVEPGTARLECADLDPSTPGVQVALENGIARLNVVAASTGSQQVTVKCGDVRAVAMFEALPELRPLLVVGAAEGVVSLTGFPRRGAGAMSRTGFEAPITQFATSSGNGALGAGAHGALFARGKVGERTLLTMGWDTDVPADRRSFRDLQTARGAPVLGDASARGYEAQSTGQLYVKLEQPGASLLYGDFVTGAGSARTLGNYSRSLTGANAGWTLGGATVTAFTSRTRSQRVTDELPGNGTSGPYRLTRTPLVENSERVEIVVRDRAQPALVVSTSSRQRFVDYEVDPVTGRLLMRAPVPSVDADLNPVSVRVTYESGDAPAAWVHGVDARARLAPGLEVGGVYVDDHDAASPFELRSVSAAAAFGPHTSLDGEWAMTRKPGVSGPGGAGRIELRHEDGVAQGRLWSVVSEPRFDSPGASITGGRQESGARLSVRLPARTRLLAEAIRSADTGGNDVREGVLASVDRAHGGRVPRRDGRAARARAAPGRRPGTRAQRRRARPAHDAAAGPAGMERLWRTGAGRARGRTACRGRGRRVPLHRARKALRAARALVGSLVAVGAERRAAAAFDGRGRGRRRRGGRAPFRRVPHAAGDRRARCAGCRGIAQRLAAARAARASAHRSSA